MREVSDPRQHLAEAETAGRAATKALRPVVVGRTTALPTPIAAMKPFSEMSAEEILQERDRRQQLRDQGKPLTHTEDGELTRVAGATPLVAGLGTIDLTLEKQVQREIVKRYKAFNCEVYNLSQARASKQTPGLPDLWVHHRVVSWWHEVKAPGGVQSPAQRQFQAECKLAGISLRLRWGTSCRGLVDRARDRATCTRWNTRTVYALTFLPPILLTPWVARRIWLAPDFKCPRCGWSYRAATGHGDLWLTCQNKRCDRTRWRAVTIYPGMIGASLIALFGKDITDVVVARFVLHRLFPETSQLSDEEQWGFELVRGPSVEYLQWEVSKLEAHRDSQDPGLGRRILKALGGL